MNSGSCFLAMRSDADDVFVQARRHGVGADIGDETPLIFARGKRFDRVDLRAHEMFVSYSSSTVLNSTDCGKMKAL